jgi:hypothetical protein
MRITEDIFWAHLQCNTKSYLKASGAMGEQRAFTEWEGKLVEDFGHPFNAGHPAPSITCREGLTTLPWHGQRVDL